MESGNNKLHIIEYQPRDVSEAIAHLNLLHHSGDLVGLMFALKMRGHVRPQLGLTGCCKQDPMAAIGAATQLLHAITDIARHP